MKSADHQKKWIDEVIMEMPHHRPEPPGVMVEDRIGVWINAAEAVSAVRAWARGVIHADAANKLLDEERAYALKQAAELVNQKYIFLGRDGLRDELLKMADASAPSKNATQLAKMRAEVKGLRAKVSALEGMEREAHFHIKLWGGAQKEVVRLRVALKDLTEAFAQKVDVEKEEYRKPYEHPISAYDRAVEVLASPYEGKKE